MLYDYELLVHLDHRPPNKACRTWDGLWRGLSRQQYRQQWRTNLKARNVLIAERVRREYQETLFEYVEGFWDAIDEYGIERIWITPDRQGVWLHADLKPRHYRFLLRRGYVAWLAWFADDAELYENIGVIKYPPWRPRRKLFRWQMPPRGKKFRQRSGPVLDSIAAVDLFPPERHVADGDEEEDDDDDDC